MPAWVKGSPKEKQLCFFKRSVFKRKQSITCGGVNVKQVFQI